MEKREEITTTTKTPPLPIDLDRWFNELTHKYLEMIQHVHLSCNEHWHHVKVMVSLYHTIKTGGLSEYNLREFSRQIAFLKTLKFL